MSWTRRLSAFALASLVALFWGALWQTQSNLADLAALGARVPFALRLQTSAQDLLGFTPFWAVLCVPALAFGFALAAPLARRGGAPFWFALAGVSALCIAVRLVDAVTPPPVLIAATRGWPGLLGMCAGGGLGGLLYARLTRRR